MTKKVSSSKKNLAHVSVIIVTYKEVAELKACLKSLLRSISGKLSVKTEVIVVDNDPETKLGPTLKKQFPDVKYVKSSGNIGFGPANNLGAHHATGKYLFFLNPDTEVQTGAVQHLAKFLDSHPRAAVVAPSLYTMTGELYPDQGSAELTPLSAIASHSILHRLWPGNPIAHSYWLRDRDLSKPQEVAVVPGTALMIRGQVFNQVQGFDEQFFIYFEESDICRRIAEAGGEMWIIPEAKIRHIWHAATQASKYNRIFRESRFKYFKKYYGGVTAVILEGIFNLGKHEIALILLAFLATLAYILTA